MPTCKDDKKSNWFWTVSPDCPATWFVGGPGSKEKAANIFNQLGIRYRRKTSNGFEYYLDYDSMDKQE